MYKDERKLRLALSFFVGRPGLAKTSKVVFLGGVSCIDRPYAPGYAYLLSGRTFLKKNNPSNR